MEVRRMVRRRSGVDGVGAIRQSGNQAIRQWSGPWAQGAGGACEGSAAERALRELGLVALVSALGCHQSTVVSFLVIAPPREAAGGSQ